jgi:hypothetical protein
LGIVVAKPVLHRWPVLWSPSCARPSAVVLLMRSCPRVRKILEFFGRGKSMQMVLATLWIYLSLML